MLGQQQRAIRDYNEAIRIDPQFARAYAGRGVSLLYLHRNTESESDFNKAFGLDPSLKKSFEPLINQAKAKR
jgi:Flp pilus assembly protein TadD